MKLIRLLLTLVFLLQSVSSFAAPRMWGKRGTATTSNATLTVGGSTPFQPAFVCVWNDGAAELIFNFSGTATTTDNVSNLTLKSTEAACYNFNYEGVVGTFQIGVITASSTALYRIHAGQK